MLQLGLPLSTYGQLSEHRPADLLLLLHLLPHLGHYTDVGMPYVEL